MSLDVLGIAGSLRAGSLNRALLRAASGLLPDGMSLETAEIGSLPLYNADIEAQGLPEPVALLKKRIARADALLIATPEYNYSVPGVLKNAIDWVSRKPDAPLDGKPVAIMSASPGMAGGGRAQYHLRQIGVFTNMLILSRPELMVPRAQEKFDKAGELIDDRTRQGLAELLSALKEWTLRLRGGGSSL